MLSTTPLWAQSNFGGSQAVDPFAGIVDMIDNNLRRWCGALIAIGLVGCGASFVFGSHNSGTYARNVFFGSMFLLAAGATGGILSVISRVRSATGSAF
jgi:hypothetical protein